ncbi:MAG: hypothetical protein KC994_09060, partial [Candidatus Omnitrophica bacterium]|nr:hypothetical protein [Candidatus Omnitrophota bacterium]
MSEGRTDRIRTANSMTPEQKKLDSLRIERPEKSSSGARGVLVTVILIGLLAAGGVFGWKNWPKTAEVRT